MDQADKLRAVAAQDPAVITAIFYDRVSETLAQGAAAMARVAKDLYALAEARERSRPNFAIGKIQKLPVRRIMTEVAAAYGQTPEDIIIGSRRREVIRPRHVAMYLCRQMADASYPAIGEIFGADHSTVMSACQKIGRQIDRDPTLASEVRELQEYLVTLERRLNEPE